MKKITLLAILCGSLAMISCNGSKNDGPDNGPIDLEKEYTELYALGGALNAWDSNNPVMMTNVGKNLFTIELDLVRNSENKLIKFVTKPGPWNEVDFLVPAKLEEGSDYCCYLKEGADNYLQLSNEKAGGLKDWFFGLDAGTSGHYILTVNPKDLTVNAEKVSSIEDKPQTVWKEGWVYMVGDATPVAWEIGSPYEMTKESEGVFTYEGVLAAGEVKFPVEFRWDGPTYLSDTEGTDITAGGEFNVVLQPEGQPDYKFRVTQAGSYKLTLDTVNLKLKVEAK